MLIWDQILFFCCCCIFVGIFLCVGNDPQSVSKKSVFKFVVTTCPTRGFNLLLELFWVL